MLFSTFFKAKLYKYCIFQIYQHTEVESPNQNESYLESVTKFDIQNISLWYSHETVREISF